MIHKKLLSLLVLLMTAASGAWAQQITITQGFEEGMGDWTMNHCNGGTGITYEFGGYEGSYIFHFYFTSDVPQYLISPELDENDGGTMSFYYARFGSDYPETFKVGYSTTTNVPTAFTWGDEVTCTNTYNSDGYSNFTYDFPAGTKYVSIACTSNDQFYLFVDDIKIEYAAAGPEVTTNANPEGAPFTEAWFNMPTFDATVNYELVRDMEIAVNAVMPASIRIQQKQQGSGYEPVDATKMIPEVKDAIDGESQAVTMTEVTEQTAETGDYTLKLQKLGDGETWVDADPDDLSVGTYRYEVTGANLYDGVCYTNEFKLFNGYPVEVPAHGFVTYYSDENLTVDAESGAVLYTITNVTGNKAVLSSAITVAPKNTPLLIYNSSDEPTTFLLIPTDGDADEVSYAAQFKGTLVDKEMPGSDDETDYYVCNGFDFAWVKQAGTLAAHRCWLEITNQSQGARTINIVFGDGTGLNAIGNGQLTNADGDLYDLNGRKVVHGTSSNATLRKGVYIRNGKKVIKK